MSDNGHIQSPVLTEDEAIHFLRLDVHGPTKPARTLRHYREKGLLRATRIGRNLRYPEKELLRFLDQVTDQGQQRPL